MPSRSVAASMRQVAGHQRIVLGEELPGIDRMAESPLRPLRQFLCLLAHEDRQVAVAPGVGLHVAGGGLAEGGQKIVVFLLPRGRLVGLAQPAGGLDEGPQAQQIPVDVGVLRAERRRCRRRESRAACKPSSSGEAFCSVCWRSTLDVLGDPLQLRPDGFQPRLVLRELGVADARPEHDAVLLPIVRTSPRCGRRASGSVSS